MGDGVTLARRTSGERVSDRENSEAGRVGKTEQSITSVTMHDTHTEGVTCRDQERPINPLTTRWQTET